MTTESLEPLKTITLEYPFTFGKKEITEVNILRRPKAKDMKGLNLSVQTADDQCKLLGRITDLSSPEIGELDIMDYKNVSDEVSEYLPSTLEDG